MNFKLYAVRVFSSRWPEALAFYRDQVGLTPTYVDESLGWAQFDLGGVSLGLEQCDTDDSETADLVGRFVGVSIQVEDLDATYELLRERGVVFDHPPTRQAWGGVLAHFRDLDDNVLTLLGS